MLPHLWIHIVNQKYILKSWHSIGASRWAFGGDNCPYRTIPPTAASECPCSSFSLKANNSAQLWWQPENLPLISRYLPSCVCSRRDETTPRVSKPSHRTQTNQNTHQPTKSFLTWLLKPCAWVAHFVAGIHHSVMPLELYCSLAVDGGLTWLHKWCPAGGQIS